MKSKDYDYITIGSDGKKYYYLGGKRISAPKGLTFHEEIRKFLENRKEAERREDNRRSTEIPEFWAKVFDGFKNFLKPPW